MAVVDDDGPPPLELRLMWQCKRFNALPGPGGVNQQDYRTMHRMTVFDNVYNAVNHMRHAVGAQIHNLSDSERAIIKWLLDTKVLNG